MKKFTILIKKHVIREGKGSVTCNMGRGCIRFAITAIQFYFCCKLPRCNSDVFHEITVFHFHELAEVSNTEQNLLKISAILQAPRHRGSWGSCRFPSNFQVRYVPYFESTKNVVSFVIQFQSFYNKDMTVWSNEKPVCVASIGLFRLYRLLISCQHQVSLVDWIMAISQFLRKSQFSSLVSVLTGLIFM